MKKSKLFRLMYFFTLSGSFFLVVFCNYLYADSLEKGKSSMSIFPILMYDTDIELGYGGKGKFINYFSLDESFDLILFNSTKGEQWYVFTFSLPDFEIRQGKIYGLSLDIKAEYDKYLKYYFYGLGADSRKDDETTFTFEKKELQLTLGRGFSTHLVIELTYFLKNIRYYRIEEGQIFTDELRGVGEQFSPYASSLFRYDTSDSRIHPSKGSSVWIQNDLAANWLGNKKANFYRFMLDVRKYFLVFGDRDVFAIRGLVQKVSGSKIPLFELPVLGGGSTTGALRGYKMNRFTDKGKWLVNAEYRFPLWKKLGGNLLLDAGSVWPSFSEMFQSAVKINAGWGLRYYLKNFVVRFDMGFSQEGMGIYFNFGHIF